MPIDSSFWFTKHIASTVILNISTININYMYVVYIDWERNNFKLKNNNAESWMAREFIDNKRLKILYIDYLLYIVKPNSIQREINSHKWQRILL